MNVLDDGGRNKIIRSIKAFESSWRTLLEEFGAPQTWTQFLPEDHLNAYWFIWDDRKLYWSQVPFSKEMPENSLYSSPIMTYWEYKGVSIWRKHGVVMIAVDTETDNNKCLFIMDEALELKDEELKEWIDGQ